MVQFKVFKLSNILLDYGPKYGPPTVAPMVNLVDKGWPLQPWMCPIPVLSYLCLNGLQFWNVHKLHTKWLCFPMLKIAHGRNFPIGNPSLIGCLKLINYILQTSASKLLQYQFLNFSTSTCNISNWKCNSEKMISYLFQKVFFIIYSPFVKSLPIFTKK